MDIVRIVIPVYKTQLDANERMSLVRSLSILKNHPFSIVCPEHLDLADLEPLFIGVNYDIRRFNAHFFDGIMGYNCLMLSPIFYRAFSDSQYILICQMDVFVFSGQLAYWCMKGYDYIGAPWLASRQTPVRRMFYRVEHFVKRKTRPYQHFFKVGNGGFSLRRVGVMLHILSCLQKEADFFLAHKSDMDFHQEDVFFSVYAPSRLPGINIPGYREAVSFAVDRKPRLAFKLTQGKLPFACHGFNKPRVHRFWKPVISREVTLDSGCS